MKYKKTSYSFKDENQIVNFGQFEGKTIGYLMHHESDYVDWCIKNFKGFKLYKKLAEKFEIIKKEKINQN